MPEHTEPPICADCRLPLVKTMCDRCGGSHIAHDGQSCPDCDEYGRHLATCPHQAYVNAYEERDEPGGPEEGGWTFTVGDPIAAVPVRTGPEAATETERLHKMLGPDGFHWRLVVRVERHFPQPYPRERPRYE